MPKPFRGIDVRALREAWRTFRPALRGQRPALVRSVLLALGVTAMELLRPWPIKLVFDRVLLAGAGRGGRGAVPPELTLVAAAAATFLISVLLGTLSVRAAVAAAQIGRKVTVRIRRQVFEHLHALAVPFHQSSRTGDLLIRLMGDVNAVRDALYTSWVNLLARGTLFVGVAAIMLALDPGLALLAMAPLPLLAVGITRSSRRLREVARKQRRSEGDAASHAAETLRHIRVVKAYAAEDRATEAFARDARSGERAGVRAARIAAQVDRMTEVLTGLGLALVLFAGARSVVAGTLSPGSLLVFVSYARVMYKPLRKASQEGPRLAKASACAARLLDVLRLPPEDFHAGGGALPFRGDVALRGVRYAYPNRAEALRGISFELEAGDLAVVRGPNGSGKSTLLSVLLRLLRPDAGQVLVDGVPVERFRLRSYRERFAYVPQDVQLFGATVRENILYGRPDATDDEVAEAARLALFDDVVARLPDGYETALGEGGATLSGGEARRLMLARAALRRARIVLLDEPMAGLDPEARPVVAAAIRRIAAGRTTLVVTHDPVEEIGPDVVLHVDEGTVRRVEDRRVRRPQQVSAAW
ncbi:MAG TPA: ABC transporter ATP-binding protein [Actinomycetota bacterium]|nr:ABC transporter ATP-binding protein [Actinomycetota bacterium]